MSIFTAKAAEKEHKDNKKNNFSPFLGSIGWKQEWATKRSEIVRVDELSKLTNGVVFVFGCVFVYEYSFGSFWSNFCLISSSYWFYDHFFAWNHGTQICFLCETQKYGEKLNNIWMITFYIGISARFDNFWADVKQRSWKNIYI